MWPTRSHTRCCGGRPRSPSSCANGPLRLPGMSCPGLTGPEAEQAASGDDSAQTRLGHGLASSTSASWRGLGELAPALSSGTVWRQEAARPTRRGLVRPPICGAGAPRVRWPGSSSLAPDVSRRPGRPRRDPLRPGAYPSAVKTHEQPLHLTGPRLHPRATAISSRERNHSPAREVSKRSLPASMCHRVRVKICRQFAADSSADTSRSAER
jgi:hypothetical protein